MAFGLMRQDEESGTSLFIKKIVGVYAILA